jgi:Cys-tRNA synthase (O-phospho-L-seryl-tRNA:Cys-tRNA synthase)
MKLEININEEELKDLAYKMVFDSLLTQDCSGIKTEERIGIRYGMEKAIKEYIYSKKDEIIERVVERASVEIVKKALPKLIEKL